jgi:hypothetical protein
MHFDIVLMQTLHLIYRMSGGASGVIVWLGSWKVDLDFDRTVLCFAVAMSSYEDFLQRCGNFAQTGIILSGKKVPKW